MSRKKSCASGWQDVVKLWLYGVSFLISHTGFSDKSGQNAKPRFAS